MSQSSVEEQIRVLGLPIKTGTRMIKREKEAALGQVGSDLWFSRWCRNVFANYPILKQAKGARFLHESCHGMPCFVVGVGPSLDADIEQLKSVKGRGIIVAVDAALRPLLANGITPDLVVSFDCKDDQNRLWKSLPAGVRVPGLFNSCTAPASIESWPGPIMFYNQYHTQDELCHRILPDVFPNLGQIPSGGTVGNMATLVAHLMGCDPVCLVGFDFCLQPAGKGWRYRAQDYRWVVSQGAGMPDAWEKTEIRELYDNDERVGKSFPVKGEGGKEYQSDPELTWYLESFKHIMPHFKVPIVNCTPNGLIPQATFNGGEGSPDACYPAMPLAQAIEKYCKTEYQEGRTILSHLDKILVDPRGAR